MACFTYERVQGVWRFWWFLNEILKGSAPGFMEDFLISCWLESGTGTCQLQLVQSQIYRLFASWKRLKCPKFVGKPQPCRLSSQGGRICRNPNSNPNPNSTQTPPKKKQNLKTNPQRSAGERHSDPEFSPHHRPRYRVSVSPHPSSHARRVPMPHVARWWWTKHHRNRRVANARPWPSSPRSVPCEGPPSWFGSDSPEEVGEWKEGEAGSSRFQV